MRAVEAAGEGGVELAVNFVLSTMSAHWASATDAQETQRPTKLVCLVRRDLGMGTGKIAAQVAHGVLAAYRSGMRSPELLAAWEAGGEPTIVLSVADQAELERLLSTAQERGLTTSLVADAGRTEVAPGSQTVGCIGPAEVHQIDPITGHLSLL